MGLDAELDLVMLRGQSKTHGRQTRSRCDLEVSGGRAGSVERGARAMKATRSPALFDEAPSPRTHDTRASEYCQEAIERAVRLLAGKSGEILAVEAHDRVRFVAGSGTNHSVARLRLIENASLRALVERRPVLFEAHLTKGPARSPGAADACVTVPVFLDDEVVALVVVTGLDSRDISLRDCYTRLGPMLFTIGLSVDRLRMNIALDHRAKEVEALRQQLDAYAVDFHSTYRAERDRSHELSAALAELEKTYKATVRGLAIAVEAKDECTGNHIQRVSKYGMLLTGLVAPDHVNDSQLEYGFLLHDVGKLTVPDAVLTKPGPLTPFEWELMRAHPESGRSILEDIPFLDGAREIVYAHHERWDGKGYPRGLKGEEIPLGAQIFPICDAYDALTNDRPYRKAFSPKAALRELAQGRGTQFWPDATDAFMCIPFSELEAVRTLGDDVRIP